MRVVIELKGERHRLVKGIDSMYDPCDRCSLRNKCKGNRYSKDGDMIHDVCHITYSGFRKIKNKEK